MLQNYSRPDALSSVVAGQILWRSLFGSLDCLRSHAECWERDVNQAEHHHDHVANSLDVLDVQLRNSECRRYLYPTHASVEHEDEDTENIECRPHLVAEKLELQGVDVSNRNSNHFRVFAPEEPQLKDADEIDEKWWRANHVRTELFSVAEAELEEMDSHECKEHEARNGQIEVPGFHTHCQFHIVRALQADQDMQEHGKKDILLDDVRWQAKPSPVQTNIEITIAVKIIRPHKNVKITDSMNDKEEDQQYGTAGQTNTVVCDLDIFSGKNGGTNLP